MGKQFSVETYEQMRSTADNLQTISETYTNLYNQFFGVADSISTAWEGADQQAFLQKINGFTDSLTAVAKKISTASQALRQITDNYSTKQEDNIAQAQKLKN